MVTGKGRGAFQAFRGRRRGTEPSSATVRSTFAPGHLVEALYVRDLLALPQRAVPRDLPALTPSVAQQSAAGVDEELVEQWNGCWEWLVDLSVVVDPEFTDEVTRRWPRYQVLLDTHQVDAWQWRRRADPPPGPGIDPRSPPAHLAARDLGHRLRDAGYWKQAGPRASVRVTGLPVGGRHSWLLPDRHLIVSREVFFDSEHLARLVQQAADTPPET